MVIKVIWQCPKGHFNRFEVETGTKHLDVRRCTMCGEDFVVDFDSEIIANVYTFGPEPIQKTQPF